MMGRTIGDYDDFPYPWLIRDRAIEESLNYSIENLMEYFKEERKKYETLEERSWWRHGCTDRWVVEPAHVIEALEEVIDGGIEFYELLARTKKISKYVYGEYYDLGLKITHLIEDYYIFGIRYPEYIQSLEHLLNETYGRAAWSWLPDGSVVFYNGFYGLKFKSTIHLYGVPEAMYRECTELAYQLLCSKYSGLPWHTHERSCEGRAHGGEPGRLKHAITGWIYFKVEESEDHYPNFSWIHNREDWEWRHHPFEYDDWSEEQLRMSIVFAKRPTKRAIQALGDTVERWYGYYVGGHPRFGGVGAVRGGDKREVYDWGSQQLVGYRWELDLRGSKPEVMMTLWAMLVRYSEEVHRLAKVVLW